MLDTDKNLRIRIADEDEKPTKEQFMIPECSVNSSLYCSVTGQNGGQMNRARFDELFIKGQLLEEFFSIAEPIDRDTKPKDSPEMNFIIDRGLYGQMERFRKHLELSKKPVSFSLTQCLFMMGWLRHFFKVDSIEDVRLLMLYRERANPQNVGDVAGAISKFSRRDEK